MIHYAALSTDIVRAYQSGASDDYGLPPERAVSDGGGNPCRHCLRDIPKGDSFLILAHRPFEGLHPYAETGPIFLCAAECTPHLGHAVPEVLETSPDYLVKGYCKDDRIIYGTGKITLSGQMAGYATDLLARDNVADVDVRA